MTRIFHRLYPYGNSGLHLRNAREKSGLSSQKHRDFRGFSTKPHIMLLFREYGVKSSKKGGLQSFSNNLITMYDKDIDERCNIYNEE